MESKNAILDHKRGDTWDGLELYFEDSNVDANGIETFLPINLTGYTFLARFKTSQTGVLVFDFKTENNTITIPNPLDGKIYLMPRKIEVQARTYFFDIQMTDANGLVKTIYEGDKLFQWNILQDIS